MAAPLSSANFSSVQPSMGTSSKTPVAPNLGLGTTKTPIMPNLGGINITVGAPNLGLNTTRTPVAPPISTTTKTPIQPNQFGVVNKSESTPLFHGSPTAMKPGTVIKPGGDKLAWAATNPTDAAHFANQGHSLEQSLGNKQASWKQPSMFNPVYEVKPSSPKDVKYDHYNKGYAASPSGFKVGKVHSWTSPKEVIPQSSEQQAQLKQLKATRRSGVD